jgi:uncharacterized surface protein with fasciclin (FAS1) repeats
LDWIRVELGTSVHQTDGTDAEPLDRRYDMERSMKMARRTALGAVVGLLSLSACGSDDGGTYGATDTAVDDVAASADELEADVAEVAADAEDRSGDLATILRDNGMDSVASAVEQIDFADLTDAPDFTFLAPNDEAFQTVDTEEAADLLGDPGAVTEVLRNHIIPVRLTAEELAASGSVETEAGNTLEVTVDGDVVMIGEGTVVRADIEVGDGIVHIVDTLYLP